MTEQARYISVYRGTDALEVDQLEQLLSESGIPVHVLGTRHGAAIGVGQLALEMRIEVPVDVAESASELIAEFLWPDGSAEEGIPEELQERAAESRGNGEPPGAPVGGIGRRGRLIRWWVLALVIAAGVAAVLIAGRG